MPKNWIRKHKKEYYYKKAKQEGYVSRAAFKLMQINEKFNIIRKNNIIVDFCCAPGGWLQIAKKHCGDQGIVIGVDIAPVKVSHNIFFIKASIYEENLIEKIFDITNQRRVDVILSDCSPKLSGNRSLDVSRQIDLVNRCLDLAEKMLANNGNFVAKVFQSKEMQEILDRIKKKFTYVKLFKPTASNKKSPEIYIIAKRYRAQK